MKVRVGKKAIEGQIVLGCPKTDMSVVETPLGVYYGSNEIDRSLKAKEVAADSDQPENKHE